MNSWHSYSSIYSIGHAAISELLKHPVYVEEKIDGSQFSFGVDEIGQIRVRSKGCEINLLAPNKMFSLAVETVKTLAPKLTPGWTYRGEYLRAPKHNSLIYSRIPAQHIILFDIEVGECQFLHYASKARIAAYLGLEVVPLLKEGYVNSADEFRAFLDRESVLGGQKIEGVVIKPVGYGLFGRDKKVLMGKFVSEAFKEVHARVWREDNPTTKDIIERLSLEYTTQARWQKALLHLNERGLLFNSPQDIGLLMKEVPEDIKRECEEEIKQKLFAFAWPHISRRVNKGLPAWYKELLLERQFEKEPIDEKTTVSETPNSQRIEDPYTSEPQGC